MKKRIYTMLAAFMITTGASVYNHTKEDLILPNNEVIKSHDLAQNLNRTYRTRPIDSLYITLHHTAMSKDANIEDIAEYHVEQRNFPEVAYHIAIDHEGNVRFLNWVDELTWHDSGSNKNSIGIVLLGNYEEYYPSKDMIETTNNIMNWLCKESGIKIRGIRAHRDTPGSATACCGKYAYEAFSPIFF